MQEVLSLLWEMRGAAWVVYVIAIALAINEPRIRRLERVYQAERRNWWRF